MTLDVQMSWQVQHFVNLEVQISWQAQHLVNLEVQISRSADFVAGTALGEPRSADFVAGTALGEPRSVDFVEGTALGEPRSADFVAGTALGEPPSTALGKNSTANAGGHGFGFENTTQFAYTQQQHLTFDCRCPVGSARRCGLLILLWHRHNMGGAASGSFGPVRCCELLILQGAQTLHGWRCVGKKFGVHGSG